MATSMKIFVKKTGEDAMPLTATLDDTIGDVKEKLQLKNVSMRLLKTRLKENTTLRDAGVKDGDTITAVSINKVPSGFVSRSSYLASTRLGNNTIKRSIAHPELHMQTQSVVQAEAANTNRKIEEWASM